MSEEIASADSLLTANAELRAALAVAMRENDGWRTLAAIHQRRADETESLAGAAYAEIARLTEALHQAASMKTIRGARKIVADALGANDRLNQRGAT